jgi:hypothetical protein
VHCFKLISLDQVKELKCFILDVFQAYIKLKGRRHSSIHCCFVLVKKSPYWAACSPYEEGTLLALYAISILCSGLLNSVFRESGSVRWVWAAGPSKCSITSILQFCSVLVLVVCLACHVRCAACSLLASIVSPWQRYQFIKQRGCLCETHWIHESTASTRRLRAPTRYERPRRRSRSASNQERHMIALDHAAAQWRS